MLRMILVSLSCSSGMDDDLTVVMSIGRDCLLSLFFFREGRVEVCCGLDLVSSPSIISFILFTSDIFSEDLIS